MSDITDALSPPFSCQLVDGRIVKFKRMLSRQWATLTQELRDEHAIKENALINKQVSEKDIDQLWIARFRMKEYVARITQFNAVVEYTTKDIVGIDRMLKFSLIDEDWEKVNDLIPPLDKSQIAWNIAHMPIVKSAENPSTPAGSSTATATAGRKKRKNGNGSKSSDVSSTSSPASTPAT